MNLKVARKAKYSVYVAMITKSSAISITIILIKGYQSSITIIMRTRINKPNRTVAINTRPNSN